MFLIKKKVITAKKLNNYWIIISELIKGKYMYFYFHSIFIRYCVSILNCDDRFMTVLILIWLSEEFEDRLYKRSGVDLSSNFYIRTRP